jgi:hypothetical protein
MAIQIDSKLNTTVFIIDNKDINNIFGKNKGAMPNGDLKVTFCDEKGGKAVFFDLYKQGSDKI